MWTYRILSDLINERFKEFEFYKKRLGLFRGYQFDRYLLTLNNIKVTIFDFSRYVYDHVLKK